MKGLKKKVIRRDLIISGIIGFFIATSNFITAPIWQRVVLGIIFFLATAGEMILTNPFYGVLVKAQWKKEEKERRRVIIRKLERGEED